MKLNRPTVAALGMLIALGALWGAKAAGLFAPKRLGEAEFAARRDRLLSRAAHAPIVPLEDQSGVRSALGTSIVDPANALDESARVALVDTITGHLAARAAADAEPYIRLTKSERTRWIGPEDKAWEPIALRYEFVAKRPLQSRDAEAALREILNYSLNEERCRLTGMGMGPDGARIIVGVARNEQELLKQYLTAPSDIDYWVGQSTMPARFYRVPLVSAEDILRRDGRLVLAHVFLVVRNTRDVPVILTSVWYWDPSSKSWQCRELAAKGFHFHSMEF